MTAHPIQAAPPERPMSDTSRPDSQAPTRRVLVIDDDVDLAESLQEILASRGYNAVVAHNIAGAEATAKALLPQVAIIDVNLGRENGLTLITTLKESFPDILCVVITARAEVEHAIEALRRGAFDYLLKPLHPLETLSRLEKCFDKIALQERAERAEAANEAKSAFLAIISHELRTPLNAIIGFAGLMEDQRFGPLGAPRYREYVSDIRNSGEHLLEIINNILDLSRAEAGKLYLQEDSVDVVEAMQICARQMQPRAAENHVQLELSVPTSPPMLRCDAAKLRQVLFNLLSNALKFTPADGRVLLKFECGADEGITLTVKDTGVGMSPADIPKALEPFTQLDNRLARRYEGTGLGLPLTRSLVELHGGTLRLESALGEGTTVIVAFPPIRTIVDLAGAQPRTATK
jgi:signal transduction histidine kinase